MSFYRWAQRSIGIVDLYVALIPKITGGISDVDCIDNDSDWLSY